ncbi:hypothetical protein D3C81_1233320 [compost metagenome]
MTLLALTAQQAVQRTGQAQQFTGMFAAEPVTRSGLDIIQFVAQLTQRAQPPGQAGPEQHQQSQQRRAKAQVQAFAQAVEGVLVFAYRLQGNNTEGRRLAAEQLDLNVIDEEFLAIGLANPRELVATPVIARGVVDVFIGRRPRTPDQIALAIVDVAEQTAVGQVVFFIRQQRRHLQLVVLDARGRNQRGDVRGQALFDRLLQGQAEGLLQGRQQAEHEQQGQQRRCQHQAHA